MEIKINNYNKKFYNLLNHHKKVYKNIQNNKILEYQKNYNTIQNNELLEYKKNKLLEYQKNYKIYKIINYQNIKKKIFLLMES